MFALNHPTIPEKNRNFLKIFSNFSKKFFFFFHFFEYSTVYFSKKNGPKHFVFNAGRGIVFLIKQTTNFDFIFPPLGSDVVIKQSTDEFFIVMGFIIKYGQWCKEQQKPGLLCISPTIAEGITLPCYQLPAQRAMDWPGFYRPLIPLSFGPTEGNIFNTLNNNSILFYAS